MSTDDLPQKPLLLYDGDCGFCRRWVARFNDLTGDEVEYAPSATACGRVAQLAAEHVNSTVVLITGDGNVRAGAEAVFATLEHAPGHRWKMAAYRRVPGFASASEWFYRFVASHRRGFSWLTTTLCGRDPTPPSYVISRWLFLRVLGLIFLAAFISLWGQIDGLIGSDGILPVSHFLDWAREQLGTGRFRVLPTLCWLSSSDAFVHVLCGVGVVASLLLIVGVTPVPVLAVLWMTYLSLSVAGQAFFSFQWDTLLLEIGFLAMFVAPAGWRPQLRSPRRPSLIGLRLQRWLLFKIMFLSGITKLLSGDPTWRDLTALDFHYETQPLPTWIGYYAHQLPDWFQQTSVVGMYVIEIGLPFLILGPRRLKHVAALGLLLLQILIAATGNYCFFNFLTMALCLLLLDDQLLRRALGERVRGWFGQTPARRQRRAYLHYGILAAAIGITIVSVFAFWSEMTTTQRRARATLPGWVNTLLDTGDRLVLRNGGSAVLNVIRPFRTINGYGLFRVMTTERLEVVVQGSDDGITWQTYEFRWKPGDVARRPRFMVPHQPRLDWQMWFVPLNPRGNLRWLQSFARGLMEASPPVLDLLGENPFPETPPTHVRFMMYRYRFTDLPAKRETGDWWQREFARVLIPPVSLPRE